MKPWRPFWKKLDFAMEELMREVESSPFSNLNKIEEWIQNLKYAELACGDSDADHLAEALVNEKTVHLKLFLPTGNSRWQLILRCECAIDFCSGYLYNRKSFDWNQEPKIIYHWLLVELWRRDAVYWASRRLGSPKLRAVVRQFRLQKEIAKLSRNSKTNPANN